MYERQNLYRCSLALTAMLLAGSTALAGAALQEEKPQSPPTEKPAAEKSDDLPEPKEILEKSLDAMGGRNVFEAVESVRLAIVLESPMGNVSISSQSAKPDKVYIVQSVPGMAEMKMGLNGKVGWLHNPMAGYQILPEGEIDQLRRQANMHNIVGTFEDQFPTMETVGLVDRDEKKCYKVRLEDEQDNESFAYFDADSSLVVAFENTQQGPRGEMTTTMTFSDWEEQDKMKLYRTVVVDQLGTQMNMKITEVEFNNVDESVFELPEEVKKMSGDSGGDSPSPGPTPPPTPQN